MKLFDGYVAVDWSASSVPKRGENSIWLAVGGMGNGDLDWYLDVSSEMPATVRQEEGLILGIQDPAGFQRGGTREAVSVAR